MKPAVPRSAAPPRVASGRPCGCCLRKHPGTAHRGAVCILSFTAVLYVRLDFSIAEDPAAEAGRKVACIAERD